MIPSMVLMMFIMIGHIGDHDCGHVDDNDEQEDGVADILLVFLHLLRLATLRHLGHHLQGAMWWHIQNRVKLGF